MDEIYLQQLSPPTVVKVARVCQFPKNGEFTRQQWRSVGALTLHLKSGPLGS